MLESKIKKDIIELAVALGMKYARMTGAKGIPDHIFFFKGKHLIIEFKQEKGELSAMQVFQIKEFKKRGITVHVPHNLEESKKILFDFHSDQL
jgi:hypothetical protein